MSWAAVVGAKGGTGATTLTLDLAKVLAGKGLPVAVVDADFAGRRSLAVLAEVTEELDLARGDNPIARIKLNGIMTVELTESLDAALAVSPEISESTASTFDAGYAMIYVDVPQPFALATRPFMMRATRYLLVTPPTLLGITGARAMINAMSRFNFPRDRIAVVLLWHAGRLEVTPAEVESSLNVPVIAQIPPLSERTYRKAIEELSQKLAGIPEEPRADAMTSATYSSLGERRKVRRSGAAMPQATSSGESEAAAGRQRFDMKAVSGLSKPDLAAEERTKLKTDIHAELGRRIDSLKTSSSSPTEMKKIIEDIIGDIVSERLRSGDPEEAMLLRQEISDEALGLGPLEDLLQDDSISEIMVNGPGIVYAERAGKLELTDVRFSNEGQLRQTIDRIITPLGRRLDEASPLVDARLPDGSRVNAIISPLALDGGILTIRRFGKRRVGMSDLLRWGTLTEQMADFLQAYVRARMNILVSGGTGSGKTTLLNIMSNFIPDGDRIITIEDAAELLLGKPHVVRLESRPPNIEGTGQILIRDLVRNALRMRPDRIIVGECRGAEALDMLQAMNTGHDGSLTTVHANSPRDSISRLEILVMMAGYDLPIRAIREQIAGAIDLIVQTGRLRDGSRKVIAITEVVGMEGDVVTLQDIVKYDQQGVDADGTVVGQFQYTGVQPNALTRFEEHGVEYDIRQLSTMASVGSPKW
ncbi:MAG TPA: ATPase, T2SS/T4P/T4SS family [Verrucomicrobiae bacterium]|nr:ATPase, T2SS/T4P/T4SS family [Verrucomicrobiae bacterium]